MTSLPIQPAAPSLPDAALRGPSLADAVDRVATGVVGFAVGRSRSAGLAWRPGIWVGSAQALGRRSPIDVVLPGGERIHAELGGVDMATDLAVVVIPNDVPVTMPAVSRRTDAGDMSLAAPRVGDSVFAVGRESSGAVQASFGRIGSVGGEWRSGRAARIERWIRLDGGLYPGLDGAAVADANGEVIGIASSAFSRHHGVVLPAVTVDRVVDMLLTHGRVPEGYLGIAAQPVRAQLDGTAVDGLLISSLADAGPAARAGLMVGDVIVRLGDEPVSRLSNLRDRLIVGASVRLAVARGGQAHDVSVDVAQRPQPVERRCG